MSDLAKAAEEFQAMQAAAGQAYARLLREVQAAARSGMTHTNISRETKLSRMTIRKYCSDLKNDAEIEEIVEIPTV